MSDMAVAGLVIAGLYVISRQPPQARQTPTPAPVAPPDDAGPSFWEKMFGIVVTIGGEIADWWSERDYQQAVDDEWAKWERGEGL